MLHDTTALTKQASFEAKFKSFESKILKYLRITQLQL